MIAYSGGELSPTVRRPLQVDEQETTPGDPKARPTSATLGESGPLPIEQRRGESESASAPSVSAHEDGVRARIATVRQAQLQRLRAIRLGECELSHRTLRPARSAPFAHAVRA